MQPSTPGPGFGLSLVAVIAVRIVAAVVTAALVPVMLAGVNSARVADPQTVLSHLAAFGLIALVVNTIAAAWLVRVVVAALGARVSYVRSLAALLTGGVASSALMVFVLASHPTAIGVVIASVVGLPVSAWVLATGGRGAVTQAAGWQYRWPPGASGQRPDG